MVFEASLSQEGGEHIGYLQGRHQEMALAVTFPVLTLMYVSVVRTSLEPLPGKVVAISSPDGTVSLAITTDSTYSGCSKHPQLVDLLQEQGCQGELLGGANFGFDWSNSAPIIKRLDRPAPSPLVGDLSDEIWPAVGRLLEEQAQQFLAAIAALPERPPQIETAA